jgi:hypothetical protein
MKREVDFLVSRNNKPWFIVEVKTANTTMSSNLAYFQDQTQAEHAFQVDFESEYVDRDCFLEHKPIKIPAKTFLSQLV